MGDGVWDVNSIAEEDFEQQLAVYLVPDQPHDETNSKLKRAEATLPRNLILKPTQAHGQPNNVSGHDVTYQTFVLELTLSHANVATARKKRK